MPPAIQILILGAALLSISTAAVHKKLSCEEFSKDSNFTSSQAVGGWYLLQLRPNDIPADAKCVQFSAINDQERQELKAQIGKYTNNLKWKNLVLKMQIPCVSKGSSNRTRVYYLEKLDVVADGAYNARLMPPPSANLVLTYFNQRHEMRLRLVEDKYLAMMDCVEQFTFLLDKQLHDKALDPALVKLLQPFLPEEY